MASQNPPPQGSTNNPCRAWNEATWRRLELERAAWRGESVFEALLEALHAEGTAQASFMLENAIMGREPATPGRRQLLERRSQPATNVLSSEETACGYCGGSGVKDCYVDLRSYPCPCCASGGATAEAR
jgi:hypothetical protein